MAKKRVIAHFMHEQEEVAAVQRLTNVQQTESYVLGEIDAADIPDLEAQGLIVQVLEDQPEVETPGSEVQPHPGARVRRSLRALSAKGPAPLVDRSKSNFYLIQLQGPLLEEWRKQLRSLRVKLLEYVPRYNYTARLSPRQVQAVEALFFVSRLRIYGAEDTGPTSAKGPEAAVGRAAGLPDVAVAMLTWDIRLHRERDQAKVQKWLKKHKVSMAGATGRKIRIYLLEDSTLADEIAALSQVAAVEEYIAPELHNDEARTLLGIDRQTGSGVAANIPQMGEGQIVAVADTGLDEGPPDFDERIVGIVALGRQNDASAPHGHGTHVSGSVLGDGTASGGKIRGAAPQAKLFFQSLLDARGRLGGLPLDLGDLFEEAYLAGARIHNNSWGAATGSMYTINAIEVDEFVAQHRDMLIVISAGNEGQAANRLNSERGFVDWLSIGSPASCKNALTVGASRSSRTSGGYANLTYKQAWPGDFPDSPIGDERVSGDAQGMAAFSSRGPCDDRRIKPDVVAPGTDIASAKSSRAPLRNFWGPFPGNGSYAFLGGTSMAAPLVAGCAALVREHYVKEQEHQPSAALLKATLINSTRWLTGEDAVADFANLPNFHQGFGCIYMPWAIPNPSEPKLKLEFVDTWQHPRKQFRRSGQRFRFRLRISGGEWLRICLTWTDVAARALQNNLNLFVQHEPSRKKWMGNADLPMGLKIPDPDNNVEVVRLENPPPGDYLIQISATNLLQTPQDFALVVTGELDSSLKRV